MYVCIIYNTYSMYSIAAYCTSTGGISPIFWDPKHTLSLVRIINDIYSTKMCTWSHRVTCTGVICEKTQKSKIVLLIQFCIVPLQIWLFQPYSLSFLFPCGIMLCKHGPN